MSKVTAFYHIVFCTKRREKTLPEESLEDIYRFIWSIVRQKNCELLRIGGITDHIHMLIDLNPSIALSEFVREVKSRTSGWMHSDSRFRSFRGWASEYFASTVSPEAKYAVIEYIRTQKSHHGKTNFSEEMADLYSRSGLIFHDKDMME